METEVSVSEVERKVGRDVILFQRFEAVLKFILSKREYEGAYAEIASVMKAKRGALEMQTLGNLAKRYAFEVHKPEPKHRHEPDVTPDDGPEFSFSFHVISNPEDSEKRAKELAALVSERNYLVHQVLANYQESDVQQRAQVSEYLDSQYQKINAEYQAALQLVKVMRESLEHSLRLVLADIEKNGQ